MTSQPTILEQTPARIRRTHSLRPRIAVRLLIVHHPRVIAAPFVRDRIRWNRRFPGSSLFHVDLVGGFAQATGRPFAPACVNRMQPRYGLTAKAPNGQSSVPARVSTRTTACASYYKPIRRASCSPFCPAPAFGVLALWRYAIAILNSHHSEEPKCSGRGRCVARLLSLRQQLPLLCCAHTGQYCGNSETGAVADLAGGTNRNRGPRFRRIHHRLLLRQAAAFFANHPTRDLIRALVPPSLVSAVLPTLANPHQTARNPTCLLKAPWKWLVGPAGFEPATKGL